MKKLLFELPCLFALWLTITPASADDSSSTLSIGVFEEHYPDSNVFFDNGKVPHALGLMSSYLYIKNTESNNSFNPDIYFSTELKWEKNPERFDSNRSPFSTGSSLTLSQPLFEHSNKKTLSWLAGADLDFNGPQNNDRHWVLHSGLQLEKNINFFHNPFSFLVSFEYAKYFYEVDDEPAAEQTNTVRARLNHDGQGFLWAMSINYHADLHHISIGISRLKAGDDQEPGGYRKNVATVSYRLILDSQTHCGINFSVIKHVYEPQVLIYADELYTTKLACSYRF